jgi:hypothetical protein
MCGDDLLNRRRLGPDSITFDGRRGQPQETEIAASD